MEIVYLIKKISILTAVPILLILGIIGLMKLLIPMLLKLSEKSFRIINKRSVQPKPIGRYGRFALGSFKIMIGYIIFIVFLQMFSLPLYFIPVFKWEPPIVIFIVLTAMAVVFSGLITYRLMQIVNKNFKQQ